MPQHYFFLFLSVGRGVSTWEKSYPFQEKKKMKIFFIIHLFIFYENMLNKLQWFVCVGVPW